jgi:hypothetical protein
MKLQVIESLLLEEYKVLEATRNKIEFYEKELEKEKNKNRTIFDRLMKK